MYIYNVGLNCDKNSYTFEFVKIGKTSSDSTLENRFEMHCVHNKFYDDAHHILNETQKQKIFDVFSKDIEDHETLRMQIR